MAELRATYRLQLGGAVDFPFARGLVGYLRDLGVSHLYLSPVWQARAGSTHGYDVIDPARVSDALGGEDGLRALSAALAAEGMGLILDVVPNHMATDDANPYWTERREQFFDVDAATGRWRRFFDVDELAGVRQEDPEVFRATHAKALQLVDEGVVDGLRIDHPDGLSDPTQYLQRLRDGGAEHVWVEKILAVGERLRPDWPVEGTVGYELCVDLAALFVDPAGKLALTELWAQVSGDARPFDAWADEAKLEQATTTFAPELDRLRRAWPEAPDALVAEGALEEAVSALGVYRTYLRPGEVPSAADLEALEALPRVARDALLDPAAPEAFVRRFQQTTSPVMAKGVEDTAFYRYHRLLALNEVGGEPGRFGVDVDTFQAGCVERAERYPHTLLVTTTHDTKRSHDTRARIGALAGMAEAWAGAVRHWHELLAELRGPEVTGPEELLVYQTLIGTFPVTAGRLEEYLVKALREAKLTTSWIDPDLDHERAVVGFAVALLDHGPFRYGFDGWVARVSEAGERASLHQTLVKLTVPGLPDTYQGDESWFLALVDPDNRRPVDWAERRRVLDGLLAGEPATRATAKTDLVRRALDLRRRRPDAFLRGGHLPIEAGEDVLAYVRGGDVLVAVTVRDAATGAGGWELPAELAGRWRDALSGAEHELPDGASLASVLGPDGRALLERVG